MKWLYFSSTALSTAGMTAAFGFSVFSMIAGLAGGLLAAFAISAYLREVEQDYPRQGYENQQLKYPSSYSVG